MENKLRGNYEVSELKQYQLKIEALKMQRNSIIAQNHAMQAELQSLIKKIKQKYLQFEISKTECGRSSYGRGDREMFTATCGDCGKECQIPFRPRENRPVYCNECFSDHKN